jgi:uncharacterized protein YbjT (DUF2867 family)
MWEAPPDDVVGYLADVAGNPQASGQTFDLGGPDILTYREMIERGLIRGRRPRIVEVPVLSPRLSSYWLHLVTPVPASVARPLVEGCAIRPSHATSGSRRWSHAS